MLFDDVLLEFRLDFQGILVISKAQPQTKNVIIKFK